MNFKLASVFLLCFSLTGCGLYVVKKSTPMGDHQGIPFYVKNAGCQRQIVRVKPYYLLTLTTKRADKTSQAESTAVCGGTAALETLLDIARTGADITKQWQALKKSACDLVEQPAPGSKDWYVTSDTISAYSYVDYQNPYTLNVRRPLMGSASATTKLAPDGTLTEGTAQVDDKTGETLIGAIPTSALAALAVVPPTPGPALSPYELRVELKAVKFTWTYHDPATHNACEKDTGLVTDPPTTGKPDLTVEDANADKKATDDSNTVKVSGSIQLPKAKDAATPAK